MPLGLFLLSQLVFFTTLWPYFLTPQSTARHDSFYWTFPGYYHLVCGILQGELPLWNPYSHAGEPFYPALLHLRLLDPILLCVTSLGLIFTKNTVLLFNLVRSAQLLWLNLGLVLIVIKLCKPTRRATLLALAVPWMSFTWSAFTQDGAFYLLLYLPWLALCLLPKKPNPIALALLIGLPFQGYFMVAALLWGGVWVAHRLATKETLPKLTPLTALVFALLALPNLWLFFERAYFVFPLRMAEADFSHLPPVGGPVPVELPPSAYQAGFGRETDFVAYTGGWSRGWEWLHLLTPESNRNLSLSVADHFGHPSEVVLYLGALTLLVALWGALFSRSRARAPLLIATGLLTVVTFGPIVIPPLSFLPLLWPVRNFTLFLPCAGLGLLAFAALGLGALRSARRAHATHPRHFQAYLVLAGTLLFAMAYLHPRPAIFLAKLFACGVLPFALLCYRPRALWALTLAAVLLTADLLYSAYHLRALRVNPFAPTQVLGTDLLADAEYSLQPREAFADYPYQLLPQAPRSAEVLFRTPTVFSPLFAFSRKHSGQFHNRFDEGRYQYRWNSSTLPRSYYELIHSSLPSHVLAPLLAYQSTPVFRVPLLATLPTAPEAVRWKFVRGGFGRVTLDVNMPEAGMLVLSQNYHPGWRVRVQSGTDRPVERALGYLCGVQLPAGPQRVEFLFRPSFGYSIAGYALGVSLGVLLLLLRPYRAFRRRWDHASHCGSRDQSRSLRGLL